MRQALALFCVLGALAGQTVPLSFIVFDVRTAQPGRLPDGWQLKVTRGQADVSVINAPQGPVVHFRSQKSSFGLERGVDVDVSQYPYLSWRWKVSQLPRGADFRHATTDDQAAQVLVLFADRRVLSYLWDSSAPKDLIQSASSIPLLHIMGIVCRSGAGEANQWISETRNLSEDFQRAYGRKPAHVKGIRLQINSQHTGGFAESEFGEVAFRSAQ